MKISFVGDVLPGGVLSYQQDYIDENLKNHLSSSDYLIGTLEVPIGTGLAYDEEKMQGRCNIVYAQENDFRRVRELGFKAVSLANNHVMDLGPEGLANTVKLLKESGIQYFGAGMNAEEASQPAILNIGDKTMAIYGYCMFGVPYLGLVHLAEENTPGVNPLIIEKVLKDIKKAKSQYDYVAIMPHWGREYRYEPLDICIQMAHQMVEAGADFIIGSHPHQIQPIVTRRKSLIAYSLGNFLFPDFYMCPPRPIWYPSPEKDLSEIKEVVGYPFPISEPIKQIWQNSSRIGCILELTIKDSKYTYNAQYVELSKQNILKFHNLDKKIRKNLSRSGFATNHAWYGKCINTLYSIKVALFKHIFPSK